MAMLMEKTMTMDYNKLEPAEGQKLLSAAKNMAGNPMAGGIDGMLRAVEPWLRSLLGLLLYGAAAVALDWRILLVLGVSAATVAAGRRAERKGSASFAAMEASRKRG